LGFSEINILFEVRQRLLRGYVENKRRLFQRGWLLVDLLVPGWFLFLLGTAHELLLDEILKEDCVQLACLVLRCASLLVGHDQWQHGQNAIPEVRRFRE
jgi:hypothetical protein